MAKGFLIKNGTIVDGTGAPPYKADVRVRDGIIAQIAPGLEREGRERFLDATDCYVTPGFIEAHNHYDGPMWWMPTLDPMPGYGITTSVNGNCGFSAAPVHDDPVVRKEMVDIFSFFEDIPDKPFLEMLPWDWRTWSEYKASMERRVQVPVNFAAFTGHIALRLAVMGLDAWERAATADELAKMCDLLDDALKAGSLGLSSNLLDHDKNDRPVPTWLADDAEWSALMEVIERNDGAVMQVIVDYLGRMNARASIMRLAALVRGRKLRLQLVGAVPTSEFQAPFIPTAMEDFENLKAEGLDIWPGYAIRAITVIVNFNTSLVFAQSNNYVWGEIIQAQGDETKFALLSDPEWRARARESWAKGFDISPLKYPEQIYLFESESGAGPVGVTLRDYMDERGVEHPSDALADWVLDNGAASILRLADMPRHQEATLTMLRERQSVGNISDSGAHGQMFCGVGDNVLLLTDYVRDTKQLKIEEAVHILTGQLAAHFNLHDRGVIAPGKAADIAVFNLDEIEQRPERKSWDVPNGQGGRTYRWTREPAPMRLTLVNGMPTFEHGDFTGKFPGRFIGPVNNAFAMAGARL